MSVLSKISVGDVFYYQVDSIPTHSAPKGSISILESDERSFIYINNDGVTTWLKTIPSAYGEMYINNNTNVLEWDSFTLGGFFSFEGTNSWTSNVMKGFVKDTDVTFGDNIQYTGDSRIRTAVKVRTTTRGGTGKWMQFQHSPAYNFSIPASSVSGFYTLDDGGTGGVGCVFVQEMTTNDQLTVAFSPIQREGGGPSSQRQFINRHAQLGAYKLDEAISEVFFIEDWESSGFTESSWNVTNDSTNVWVVGQAQNNTASGTSSSYVSDDGGTSASYTITTSNVSHFYKDFVIPNDSSVELVFDWKCQAENAAGATQYDYGAVVITDTGTTPAAGSEVTTVQTDGAATTRIGAVANLGKFNLAYGTNPATTWNTETISLASYAGQTKRLVFTWKNDGSVGADPPFVVDNIQIKNVNWG